VLCDERKRLIANSRARPALPWAERFIALSRELAGLLDEG
jgi:hypothetical protein